MSRTQARECGFKLTFQYLVNKNFIMEAFFEENELEGSEKEFTLSVFSAVKNNLMEIEEKLSRNLKKGLELKDIFVLDKAILICAIAQIDYLKEDKGLVINEAVRWAKKYSTEKSPAFINAVLSSF